jgi:hypothetical protein
MTKNSLIVGRKRQDAMFEKPLTGLPMQSVGLDGSVCRIKNRLIDDFFGFYA